MPNRDAVGKRYMSDNTIFADAFNFLIYGGRQVIKPEELTEADTTELALPGGTLPAVQKYRDVKKVWAAKRDSRAVYVLLGGELQDKVHYAMPVRDMFYDVIDYAGQVDEVRRSYRNKSDDGEFSVDGGTLKVKLTSEEFLSGFRKTDKLIPVITATIYFGANDWDGPLSIHDMLDVDDEALLRVIPNYFVNLLAPARIDDADFEKFGTDLGIAMKVLKYQDRDKIGQVFRSLNHRKVGRLTAEFLNVQANLGLQFEEPSEEGEVDMCKGMELFIRNERADENRKATKEATESTLLQNVKSLMETVKFTAEQAMNALRVPAADQARLAAMLQR